MVKSLWKIVGRFLRKLELEPPYDPAILLLVTYSKKREEIKEMPTLPRSLHFLQWTREHLSR